MAKGELDSKTCILTTNGGTGNRQAGGSKNMRQKTAGVQSWQFFLCGNVDA
jgi:hypothetical protein